MSMQLFSQKLLENEIKKIEDTGITENNELLHSLLKRELLVIERIKIDVIDITGKIDEVNNRLLNQSIYFMNPKDYEEMKIKAKKYDTIKKFIDDFT